MKEDESGVCTSISDTPYIKINNQFYSSYTNVAWDYRLGTYNQSIIKGFHNTSTYYADGRKVVKDSPVTYTTTGIDIEELTMSMLFRVS